MIICRKGGRSRHPVSRDIRTSLYRTKGAKKSIGSSTKNPCVICAVQGRTNFHVAPGRAVDVDAVQGRTNFHVAPGRAGDVDAVPGRTNVARDRMSGATVFAVKISYSEVS